MTELRRYARAPFDCELVYRITGDTQEHPGRARDISLGGMFITCEPPPFGSNVTVRFHIVGEKDPLELPAVVRWSGDGGMGVQFLSIGARETHHITNLTRP